MNELLKLRSNFFTAVCGIFDNEVLRAEVGLTSYLVWVPSVVQSSKCSVLRTG
jgi:hypothetical protein